MRKKRRRREYRNWGRIVEWEEKVDNVMEGKEEKKWRNGKFWWREGREEEEEEKEERVKELRRIVEGEVMEWREEKKGGEEGEVVGGGE